VFIDCGGGGGLSASSDGVAEGSIIGRGCERAGCFQQGLERIDEVRRSNQPCIVERPRQRVADLLTERFVIQVEGRVQSCDEKQRPADPGAILGGTAAEVVGLGTAYPGE
jgi:hypothetical protein